MPNVHKDFHGALSYGLQFLDDRFGPEALETFLCGLADTVYRPLAEALRERGLEALREHWQQVFELEGGDVDVEMEDDTLVLTVQACPAVCHLHARGYAVAERFCEHTRLVNDAICRAAGYAASVEYDQAAGRCVQRFWRVAP